MARDKRFLQKRCTRTLAWKIEYDKAAEKQLGKLDKPIAKQIRDYMREVAELDSVVDRGDPLEGNLAGLWRYRVGKYRIICDIVADVLVVYVIDIDHRDTIYKKRSRR